MIQLLLRLIPTWGWAALIAGSLSLAFAWHLYDRRQAVAQGRAECEAVHQAAVLKATQQARQVEENWQSDAKVAEDVYKAELRRITADRDRAIARLRNNASRSSVPPVAQPAADAGSTSTVSASDGIVLIELASEADRLRAGYQACISYVQSVTKTP